ncbi:hypothetical protein QVD17_09228 [Tagetes erecta]|uniref:DUF6821 domain-containing protein n=1 Tax=Tagetes erecta TaxID=13708 RepID=A0AAD8P3S1_TARER|nr:hypothetical protein QVD17_09228 [Tagetes erecta]
MDINDWELIDDTTSTQITTTYLEGIERDSEGVIRSDYFSLDSHNNYLQHQFLDQISVDSDNPSWIDPICDTNYSKTKPIAELWSTDASSDDDAGRYVESEAANNEVLDVVESVPDSAEIELKHDVSVGEELESEEKIVEARGDDDEERNKVTMIWWKLPLDLLKYCLFKASPVWTISVAAAMMGVVILGRRLYRMKHRTRSLQLKVAIDDDKKVSQVMSRAARLNEAFSVVKRAPIIRPSLPATGIVPWPVMALR